MLNTTSIVELDGFLSNHEAVAKPRVLALGSVVGGWKIIGFLGSGGTSEVYRVKCLDRGADSPIFAALKILVRVARYILSVCRAVDGLHRAGRFIATLSPNIMRRSNGDIVLIDLGLVKDKVRASRPENGVSLVSEKIVAVGTPRFAAPEQMMGGELRRRQISTPSDVLPM